MSFVCMSEGCRWNGTSQCVECGGRLRCPACKCYVREDNIDAHLLACDVAERMWGPPEDSVLEGK